MRGEIARIDNIDFRLKDLEKSHRSLLPFLSSFRFWSKPPQPHLNSVTLEHHWDEEGNLIPNFFIEWIAIPQYRGFKQYVVCKSESVGISTEEPSLFKQWEMIATVTEVFKTGYRDYDVTWGRWYKYKVIVMDVRGNMSFFSNDITIRCYEEIDEDFPLEDVFDTADPNHFTVSGEPDQIMLRWKWKTDAPKGAYATEIQRKRKDPNPQTEWYFLTVTPENAFMMPANPSDTWEFRFRAVTKQTYLKLIRKYRLGEEAI